MRPFAKATARTLAAIAVLPAVVVYQLSGRFVPPPRVFAGWSQAWSLIPGIMGVYLRFAFYRKVLVLCGDDAWIGFGSLITDPSARIGRTVYIGPYCVLGSVTLEDDVLLGSNVSVINGARQHGIERLDVPIREQTGEYPRVTVGYDSWVGDRTLVMADVGCHCVVGGGSVVTKPIPDYAIAVGNPARVLRFRDGRPIDRDEAPNPFSSS